jgi:hypothetical protein
MLLDLAMMGNDYFSKVEGQVYQNLVAKSHNVSKVQANLGFHPNEIVRVGSLTAKMLCREIEVTIPSAKADR